MALSILVQMQVIWKWTSSSLSSLPSITLLLSNISTSNASTTKEEMSCMVTGCCNWLPGSMLFLLLSLIGWFHALLIVNWELSLIHHVASFCLTVTSSVLLFLFVWGDRLKFFICFPFYGCGCWLESCNVFCYCCWFCCIIYVLFCVLYLFFILLFSVTLMLSDYSDSIASLLFN